MSELQFKVGDKAVLRMMTNQGRPYFYGIPECYVGQECEVVRITSTRHSLGTEYRVKTKSARDAERHYYGDEVCWFVFEPMLESTGGPW